MVGYRKSVIVDSMSNDDILTLLGVNDNAIIYQIIRLSVPRYVAGSKICEYVSQQIAIDWYI